MKKVKLKEFLIMLLISITLLFPSMGYSLGEISPGCVTKVELNSTAVCSVCGQDRNSCTCLKKDINLDCGLTNQTLELYGSGPVESTPEVTKVVLDGIGNDVSNLKTIELEFSVLNSIEIAGTKIKRSISGQGGYVKVIPCIIESNGTKKVSISLNKITAKNWWESLLLGQPKNSTLTKIRYRYNPTVKTRSEDSFIVYSRDKGKMFSDAVTFSTELTARGKNEINSKINFTNSDVNGKNVKANLMFISSHGSYDTGSLGDLGNMQIPTKPPRIIGGESISVSSKTINNSGVNWLIISACKIFHPSAEYYVTGYISQSKNLKGIFGYGAKITVNDDFTRNLASRCNESMLNAWFKSNAEIWYSRFTGNVKPADNKFNTATAIISTSNMDDPMYGDISQKCQEYAVVRFKLDSDGTIHRTLNGDSSLKSITLVISIGSSSVEREVTL